MRWSNKRFPLLNFIKGKIPPYDSKVIQRHYHYHSDPKLGPGIFTIRRVPCIFHAFTTLLSFSWDSKTKEAVNQPGYGLVYNWKYPQTTGCNDNLIIILFLDDVIDEVIY